MGVVQLTSIPTIMMGSGIIMPSTACRVRHLTISRLVTVGTGIRIAKCGTFSRKSGGKRVAMPSTLRQNPGTLRRIGVYGVLHCTDCQRRDCVSAAGYGTELARRVCQRRLVSCDHRRRRGFVPRLTYARALPGKSVGVSSVPSLVALR